MWSQAAHPAATLCVMVREGGPPTTFLSMQCLAPTLFVSRQDAKKAKKEVVGGPPSRTMTL